MSGDPRPAALPRALLEAAYREARRAFPDECCGWIAGDALRPCANQQAGGTHPTAAGRTAETAYVITGADLIAFSRAFDGAAPPRVIYHSHPNGRAYLSETDRAVATSPWGDGPAYPVQQLVVGIDAERVTEAALFAWSDAAGGFVEVARFEGADL
jgi:proteasome lid subunit RPN8/RPN11